MPTMRSIVKSALAKNSKLTNRELRNIVAIELCRPSLYNLCGSMVKQEREQINNILLFVYGTLMRGFGNNRVIYDGTFLMTSTIKGFDMYTNRHYPMLVESDDPEKIVQGELFLINSRAFKDCDYLEGYPSHYNRKQVQTEKGLAWVYFWEKQNFELRSNLVKIDTGDFRAFKNEEQTDFQLAVNL